MRSSRSRRTATSLLRLRTQAEVDWRAHERARGRQFHRDAPVMEHTPEEAAWIANRMDELAAKRYSAEAIEQARQLPKSGAEISAETAERYRERQQRSTSLHEQVGEMDKRGRERDAARKAGVSSGFTEGRDAYRAAVRAAEERAAFGEVRTAYDPNAVERVATPGGYGPAGDWPDELGPAI